MGQNMRQHPRISTDIKINIRTRDGKQYDTLAVENISLGGVFIEMSEPLGFGVEVSIAFSIKQPQRQIRCTGHVVWTRKVDTVEGAPGIGVRLADISIGDMRALEEYIDQTLIKRG